eukprot:gnl/TRDRNA2_/TRDRNA2_81757_c0_seq2.p1 gnl/TRDRNA2_/TRDRNA2_81757_c0~~gnl/TRDRNA2_/TRDRNA2_81757_c0_seq2.p1  ORF type:complete len:369 (+),score=77.70 gnl/TRDRNA2_/TRDRNA2_81757_c0_seq2:354-1460(+)
MSPAAQAPRPPPASEASTAPNRPGGEPQQHLSGSLQETWQFLKRERPEDIEAGELRCAIERSLLDCALQLRSKVSGAAKEDEDVCPEDVLGVSLGASPTEVKAAYREKALALHPDKGGDPKAFCRVQRAYLALTKGSEKVDEAGQKLALPDSSAPAFQLRDHKALVKAKFEEDGVDLDSCIAKQRESLQALGLIAQDMGAINRNEKGELMYNQCFYLSLARSYLGGGRDAKDKEALQDTALLLKRVIEAAVLEAHPDWGGNRVGEDIQAFSDFLFFVLGSNALLSEVSVAIFDSVTGGVEIYTGRSFPGPDREAEQRSNLLTVQYMPGHYQALVPAKPSKGQAPRRPTLLELQKSLDAHGVLYLTTNV